MVAVIGLEESVSTSHPRQQQRERTTSLVGEPSGLVKQLPDVTQCQPAGRGLGITGFADVDDAVMVRVSIEPAALLRLVTFRDDPSVPLQSSQFSRSSAWLDDARRREFDVFLETCFGLCTKQKMKDTAQTPAHKIHAPGAAAIDNRLVPRRNLATLDRDTNLPDTERVAVNRHKALIIEVPRPKVAQHDFFGCPHRGPGFADPCPELSE